MPYKDSNAQRAYRKAYYQKNKEKAIAYSIKSSAKRKKKYYDILGRFKTMKGCCQCGYNKCPGALQFHHTEPAHKDDAVSNLVRLGYSFDRIKQEVSKCIVLCANCHAEKHWSPD